MNKIEENKLENHKEENTISVPTPFLIVTTSAPKNFQSHDTRIGVVTFFAESRHNVFNVATFSQSRNIASTMSQHSFQSRDTCPNSKASSLFKRTLTENLKFQIKILKHLNPNSFMSSIFENLTTMSNPSSPAFHEIIEKIMKEEQGERAEQPENQETTPTDDVRKEVN